MEGRKMKSIERMVAISLAVMLLTIGAPAAPGAAETPPAEPPCADSIGDSGQSSYVVDATENTPGEAVLSIYVFTRQPLCADGTITVNVSTDGVTFTPHTYSGVDGSGFVSCGATCVKFTQNYESTLKRKTSAAPATVYVFVETTADGTTPVDRGPDEAGSSVPFTLCDQDTKYHKNYDNTGTVIPPCNPPGGNYFQ
jgi:hypothetical protein